MELHRILHQKFDKSKTVTFLFDIGRVLLDFEFEPALIALLPEGKSPECIESLLKKKDAFERGNIELNDYVAEAMEIFDGQVSEEQFLDAWRGIFTPNRPMWELVEKLAAADHRLLLFSNINPIHYPWLLSEFSIFRLFEGGTFSFQEGLIKPEDAIYAKTISDHNLTPSQVIYIDDLPLNVASGRRAGFQSYQYRLDNHADFMNWLEPRMNP